MQLVLADLGHHFPGAPPLFTGLNAHLESGEVTAVVGPSGSGKSTLLSLIAGWLAPTTGTISRPPGARLTWVFQNPFGVAHRTAVDHIVLPYLAHGLQRPDAEREAHSVLRLFGLAELAERQFADLSGGEAQRLMLARAVASAPDLMLVDEPTAQLDRTSAGAVIEALGNLASTGALVVIATHDPRVREVCHRVIDLGTT